VAERLSSRRVRSSSLGFMLGLRSALGDNSLALGIVIIAFIVLLAIFADKLTPYKPLDMIGEPLQPPSRMHLLGTDDMGRDLLTMVVYGSRVSLLIGVLAAILATAIGTIIGLLSAVIGGKLDVLISRSIDFVISLPYLAVALAILAFLKPSIWVIVVVIAALGWVTPAKVVRTSTLTVLGMPYVEAAYALGSSKLWIVWKHVLPGVMPFILSSMVLNVRSAILFEASLSFLGMGDPSHVSWGTILFYARRAGAFMLGAWWWIIPPGLMIMLTVLGFTLIAIGLDRVLNPRLR